MLGICNGFQVLCEAGLLPGALLRNEELRFVCRQVELVADSTSDGRRRRLSIPVKHAKAATGRPRTCSTSSRRAGRSPTATRRGRTRTARSRDIAGVTNEAGNVLGLMPHPEHAVDPLTGSDDGLEVFRRLDEAAGADAKCVASISTLPPRERAAGELRA